MGGEVGQIYETQKSELRGESRARISSLFTVRCALCIMHSHERSEDNSAFCLLHSAFYFPPLSFLTRKNKDLSALPSKGMRG